MAGIFAGVEESGKPGAAPHLPLSVCSNPTSGSAPGVSVGESVGIEILS
jgi:hypothetical protein